MKRPICVVTGSRAEFGLLRPLMREISSSSRLRLITVATGAHLAPEHGLTYREIEGSGFRVDARVEMLINANTETSVARSVGMGQLGFVDVFHRLKPAVVVVLGDRYEIFSAVSAAYLLRIPVAHIHGGEVTEGAIDDGLRHAMTKLSLLHFTSTEVYRRRVIQMGESPARVHNVGALALDNIRRLRVRSRRALEQDLGFQFGTRTYLVTYHPTTLEPARDLGNVRRLLRHLGSRPDRHAIITGSNADPLGRRLAAEMRAFVDAHPGRFIFVESLGSDRYLQALAQVDGVVGNSSSGIIEAPSFGVGTINIGARQDGRLKPLSVIDCDGSLDGLERAFRRLDSPEFRRRLKKLRNPYGDGRAAARIRKVLEGPLPLSTRKSFHDEPHVR